MVDLGVRLQQLRMDRNMSQSELGKALNRSKSVISAYENDLRIPPLEVLTEIALIFNVSLDFLVGIDKAEMVSVDGLNDTQKAVSYTHLDVYKRQVLLSLNLKLLFWLT